MNFTVGALCLALCWSAHVASQCTLTNPTTEKKHWLQNLSSLKGQKFVVTVNGSEYSLSICPDVTQSHLNATVTRTILPNSTEVLGRMNETDITSGDSYQILTYAGGDRIASGSCMGIRHSSILLLSCSKETTAQFHLLDPLTASCTSVFTLKTSAACVPKPQSGWTTFFLVLLTAIICYFVIGMAYRRFVTGAKGFEQIPNYEFWRSPIQYIHDRTTSHEPWTSQNPSRHNDSVDEPLLHP